MRTILALLLALGLAGAAVAGEAKKEQPKDKKGQAGQKKDKAAKDEHKSAVATDPAKAGPDFETQGEYLGKITADGVTGVNAVLGAEVVARGDGKFLVNLLPGGLRGEGGQYDKRAEGQARRDGGAVKITGRDDRWSAAIADGRMTGKTPEGRPFVLEKVVRKSRTLGLAPPPGAVVLFRGGDAAGWEKGKVVDGHLLGNDTASKEKFGDHKLHLEFRLSFMPGATGQGRSNSGVYVQRRYEVQVLDSFGLKGENNECGGIYQQATPKLNMCYPPLTWQTYDIDFKAARYGPDGKKTANAYITVAHNGQVIHDSVELTRGATPGQQSESPGPEALFLQGHGGQVQYRNIWVVPVKDANATGQ